MHAWREHHRELLEKLTTGGGSRSQPLQVIITTAGDGNSELWKEENDDVVSILEGAYHGDLIDDQTFGMIFRIDDDDDAFDPANWRHANPNLGVSVTPEYLQSQADKAQRKSTEYNAFLRYHANQETSSAERFIMPELWATCGGPTSIEPDDACCAGLDLGRSYDWSALTAVFPKPGGEYHVKSIAWTCEDGDIDTTRDPFRSFVDSGDLIVHPGNSLDFEAIENDICQFLETYYVRQIRFDPTASKEMAARVMNRTGVELSEFYQTFTNYNEPIRRCLQLITDGKLVHGNNPCLTWQAGNLDIKRDAQDRWFPEKTHKRKKVDAMVGLLMGLESAICLLDGEVLDYYETGEVESF